MKQFHCFSMRLAGYLMMRGFVMFEVQNDRDSVRKIYIFKDSEELRRATVDYKSFKFN